MSTNDILDSAYRVLNSAILNYQGKPVGTVAALNTETVEANYQECFVRDFVPSAITFMSNGEFGIVRHFLDTVMHISSQQQVMEGHERAPGLMPASFKVVTEKSSEKILADFGERAIGRVAPVDSAMWWIILLYLYHKTSGDSTLTEKPAVQTSIRMTLQLYLKESFETSPSMLVPDAAFMIDRRMGVYGHPLEIQALFYGMLKCSSQLLADIPENQTLRALAKKRMQTLRSYIRMFYWMDIPRLNEIHRYKSEEFGDNASNLFNIYPETIPDWIDGWIKDDSGYFVGNLGPGRMDFRYFSMGNMLAILFGLATEQQAHQIMNLYQFHWMDLAGKMPIKIVYPALIGYEWALATGSDPKNAPWSYHNGGNWPALIWVFAAACTKTRRLDLLTQTLEIAGPRLANDDWPEYYDGKQGSLIGRRANLQQVWSAAAMIIADKFFQDGADHPLFKALTLQEDL